ncbi:truncated transposase [Streptococcus dysgalactiae subsp. equisimilis GGS_124]|nr:truncated transposase [Streptococcus dysgalactiae subsp. equisimilis GGS_124]
MNGCSARFIAQLESALTANIRLHSVDSFVQTYKVNHPEEVVPSTKTIYRYIKEGLLAIKPSICLKWLVSENVLRKS